MIRILIADSHQLVRRGLRQLLELETDFEVVGEGANGREILDLLEQGIIADVLLTDLSMPVMGGLELSKAVIIAYPELQVALLTIQEDESFVRQAFQAGVKSYLFKTAHEDEVIFAVRQVARRKPYLCSGLSDRLISRTITGGNTSEKLMDGVEFSERELEVLKLMTQGLTNDEMAKKLFTSRRTIEGYRQSLMDKTGSRNSLALVWFATRHGLVN